MSEVGTKRCSRCKETKPLSDFYKNKSKFDGLQSYCKWCINDANRRFCLSDTGKISQRNTCLRQRIKYQKKYVARYILNNAISRRKFPSPRKLNCFVCGQKAREYHHFDYNKPMKVKPICSKCHKTIHLKGVENARTKIA
jgi:hypothetical protein